LTNWLCVVYYGMFEIKEGRNGNVILTVTDRRGNVVLHETVKAHEAELIAERTIKILK
jgi:hypothetical protein